MHRPSPELWSARIPDQVYVIEQHARAISDGPGVVFTALIPDMDHFKGSEGGRALPMLHPNGEPNLAPRLLTALGSALGVNVSHRDVLAYVAGVVAHPGFTRCFADELTTPGIRVPVTADAALWDEAVTLGSVVLWTHTYGDAFADPAQGRPRGEIRYPLSVAHRPLHHLPITAMPTALAYDPDAERVLLGDGNGAQFRNGYGSTPSVARTSSVRGSTTAKPLPAARRPVN